MSSISCARGGRGVSRSRQREALRHLTETPHQALVKAVIAHATLKKRGTRSLSSRLRARECALYGTRPAAASWGEELRKGSSVVGLSWELRRGAASVITPDPLREQCMVTTSLLLAPVKKCSRCCSRSGGRPDIS